MRAKYNSTAPTFLAGTMAELQADASGNLKVTSGTGTTAGEIQGNVASGSADSGNPIKVVLGSDATDQAIASEVELTYKPKARR